MITLPPLLTPEDRIRRAPRAQAEELEPVIREHLYGERHHVDRVAPNGVPPDARRDCAARPLGERRSIDEITRDMPELAETGAAPTSVPGARG
jgi:hypothetical protein